MARDIEITQVGRWTVLKSMHAIPRRPRSAPGHVRARAQVRCVCGHEQAVWVEDLIRGRSRGCASLNCRMRSAAIDQVKRLLDEMAVGDPKNRPVVARFKTHLDRWQVKEREREIERARERLEAQLTGQDLSLGRDDMSEADTEAWVDECNGDAPTTSVGPRKKPTR